MEFTRNRIEDRGGRGAPRNRRWRRIQEYKLHHLGVALGGVVGSVALDVANVEGLAPTSLAIGMLTLGVLRISR